MPASSANARTETPLSKCLFNNRNMSKAAPVEEPLVLLIQFAKVKSFANQDATLKNGFLSRSENHNQNSNNFTTSFANKKLRTVCQ